MNHYAFYLVADIIGFINLYVERRLKRHYLDVMITKKQKLLYAGYKEHGDLKAAYKEAGYSCYTASNAKRLLAKALAAQSLAPIPHPKAVDPVVKELESLAYANILDIATWTKEGGLVFTKSSAELTRAQAAGILSVTSTPTMKGYITKIVMHPKEPALDKLYKILKDLDSAKVAPAQMSAVQINMILGNPVWRRAAEELALAMQEHEFSMGGDQDMAKFHQTVKNAVGKVFDVEDSGSPGDADKVSPSSAQRSEEYSSED